MDFNLNDICIGNAAGTVKTLHEFKSIIKSAVTEVTVGSVTLRAREGNSGQVYYFHPDEKWSINSLGMPNAGMKFYRKTLLPEMKKIAGDAGKKLRVSIAGFSPAEYHVMADDCMEIGVDAIEINLGCPNVWNNNQQKSIASYHPELVTRIMEELTNVNCDLDIKISPVLDYQILHSVIKTIIENKKVTNIVVSNTIPNEKGTTVDGKPALSFNSNNNELGGKAGKALRVYLLDIIPRIDLMLPRSGPKIKAVGGIFDGTDIKAYANIGASSFQVGTAYLEYGNKIFSGILYELVMFEEREKVA
jgi:dihydroorotate dehydrogenase (fumarate)